MRRKLTLLTIAVLFIGLVAQRVWRSAGPIAMRSESAMPEQLGEVEERELLLSPGGIYTLADIEDNGQIVPSYKYRSFRAHHDYDPMPGDRICPVTRTKASPSCTWTVGGRVYEFCCPPCIEEFVRLAKENPEDVLPPDAYVKR